MSKNMKGIITVAVIIALAGAAYLFLHKTKKTYANAIVKSGKHGNFAFIMTFDEGFLKEWAKAVKNGSGTFRYNGKAYFTQGGTSNNL